MPSVPSDVFFKNNVCGFKKLDGFDPGTEKKKKRQKKKIDAMKSYVILS